MGRASSIVLAVACATVLVLGGQVLIGATEVGLGVDDHIHALRGDAWVKTGWYVPEYALDDGEPRSGESPWVYGAAFAALAHLANVALGNESMGEVSLSGDAYAVRHMVVALFGLATVLCVGSAVWTLTRNGIAAVWSCAALVAIPVWAGHAMFNIKDIPVAAGFTFVTVGLVLALSRTTERAWPRPRTTAAVGALVAFGVLFSVGTRPAMWVPLLCSLLAFVVLAWVVTRSRRAAARALAVPAISFVVGLAAVLTLHPRTAGQPLEWLINSVSGSGEAGREGAFTLTAGELVSEYPPAWYLPTWTFVSVPILILAVVVVGAAIVIRNVVRSRPGQPDDRGPAVARTGGMLLVSLQLLLLPVAAIVAGSPAYAGLRQHLYIVPAVAIVAGVGAARILDGRSDGARSSGWRLWAPALILCLALIIPAIEQSRLYPYNYVYVNEVGGIGGMQGRWETEYQFISAREAFQRVPEGVAPKCSARMIPREGSPLKPIIEDCYSALPPYYEELGLDPTHHPWPDKLWVVGRPRAGNRPPGFCDEQGNVTRPLRGEEIVMTYVLLCELPPGAQRARESTDTSASTNRGSSS
jgi:hypothetical protein